ncbi:hypothetical protein VCUG_01873 [Vavraia culicis subsp. floridensis]|uniref:Transcription elongation factor 1 homolog n=1 Tax=Vavraia culicis (isolate floridensis) TaxID=948595 RepID=L2GTD6_VAVCU|nr:uncharacterized protein VCUG_01873 [Vavraia culicis subsp. floridensis]ELA46647.1 hypothetical protein VCUG_01873 [Vavraia culicis subsp. floridensis]
MGRKKTRRSQIKSLKSRFRMETRFNCPRCNNEQAVRCTVERSTGIGVAYCTLCEAKYKCRSNNLTTPIDVYSSWIDEIDK